MFMVTHILLPSMAIKLSEKHKKIMSRKTRDEAEAMKHCGFAAPAYGEVVPVGTEYKDAWGNTHLVTEHGDKIIREA